MDLQELMTFLEIEKPEEFEYFEHLAALFQMDEAGAHTAAGTFNGAAVDFNTYLK